MNMAPRKIYYGCKNRACRNPSDVYNELCQYCKISQFGTAPGSPASRPTPTVDVVPPLVEFLMNPEKHDCTPTLKENLTVAGVPKKKPGRKPKYVSD